MHADTHMDMSSEVGSLPGGLWWDRWLPEKTPERRKPSIRPLPLIRVLVGLPPSATQ